MKTFALIAPLLSLAAAQLSLGDWQLYCGDSCGKTNLIASGDVSTPSTGCVALPQAYAHCYFETSATTADGSAQQWYNAYIYSTAACSGNAAARFNVNGSCTDAGAFTSYQVTLHL